MVMQYDNEYETKENKNKTKDRIEPQQLHRGIQHLLPLLSVRKSWRGRGDEIRAAMPSAPKPTIIILNTVVAHGYSAMYHYLF